MCSALVFTIYNYQYSPPHFLVIYIQSLKSRGLVKEQFAWRHYYWYLTNEGIQYLRDFLHLPPEIVPSTLKRQTRPDPTRPRPKAGRYNCVRQQVLHPDLETSYIYRIFSFNCRGYY